MRGAIWRQKDFWAGIMFLAVGVATVVLSRNYALGTAARMGPGYFPTVLGFVLSGLGGLMVAKAVVTTAALVGVRGETVGRIAFRPLLLVSAAVAVFGLGLDRIGLIPSSFLAMMVAASASHEFRWLQAAVNAAIVTALNWAVFVVGLKVTMPVWPKMPVWLQSIIG